jgi:hypothetical protein
VCLAYRTGRAVSRRGRRVFICRSDEPGQLIRSTAGAGKEEGGRGTHHGQDSCLVVVLQAGNLIEDVVHLAAGPLDGGAAVALALPALHVPVHFVVPTLLLLGVVARLADVALVLGLVHELEPARLAHPVLLVALLPKVAPAPVAATPASLVKVAHCSCIRAQRVGVGVARRVCRLSACLSIGVGGAGAGAGADGGDGELWLASG